LLFLFYKVNLRIQIYIFLFIYINSKKKSFFNFQFPCSTIFQQINVGLYVMAKSVSSKKSTSSKPAKKNSVKQNAQFVVSTILDGRIKKIVGLMFVLFSLFLFVAFISYVFTWQDDQDKVFNNTSLFHFLFKSPDVILNKAGRLGAWVAHEMIYNGFGMPSFLFAIFFSVWGLNLMLHKRIFSTLKSFFYNSFFILFLSPVLAYFLPKETHEFSYGGALGNDIISKLNTIAGETGTLFLMIGMGLVLVIVLFNPIFHLPIWHQLFEKDIENNESEVESIVTTEIKSQLIIDSDVLKEKEIEKGEEEYLVKDPFADDSTTNNPTQIEFDDPTAKPIEPIHQAPNDELIIENNPSEFIDEIEIHPTPMTEDLSFEVIKTEDEKDDIKDDHVSVASNEPYDPSLELRNYKFPTLDLLEHRAVEEISIDKNELEQNKNQIINTLKSFGIAIAKISATVGPTVTLYEIVPAEGVRISKIRNLEDDIALSLSALGIRIIAPIPGKGTIGIEVPNIKKQIVSMRTLINSDKFRNNDFSLPIALGKKIDNENYIVDLATMPHLLMAGATGQGKSVGINTILVSLLYKKHPSQLKFVMIDPKKVELSVYKHIEKHFLAKLPNEEDAIITDTKKAINTLNSLCIEMDNRYDLLKEAGVRNIKEYNEKFIQRRLNPNKGHQYLPFIVLVVDEFADLIMTAGKEIELPIARLAQLARAIGIHLIIATQRPSVNVITGTIKANFPGRVAFRVSAKVDSRTILDTGGADQLIGRGDMLILNGNDLVRIQCAFVDTPEVERIVDFIGNQQGYPTAFDLPEYEGADGGDFNASASKKTLKEVDNMFAECARMVISTNSGSTSMLQRRFNLGYNRAGRIMDQMEAAGIVGSSTGGKPRELLVHSEMELEEILKVIIK
jgi:S-DNA-T family DNA segregation ATPase FtsK/SpoIIIE